MCSLITTLALSNILVISVIGMEPALKNVQQEAKPQKLKLQPMIQLSEGTAWDFSRLESEDSNFQKFIQDNCLKNAQFLGIAQLSPYSVLAALLATLKQKDDACIFIKMTFWSPIPGIKLKFFSHAQVISSHKITRVKVAQENAKNLLDAKLYVRDEKSMSKDLLTFDYSGIEAMKLIGQKTLKTWSIQK